jgi:hypothetical protein
VSISPPIGKARETVGVHTGTFANGCKFNIPISFIVNSNGTSTDAVAEMCVADSIFKLEAIALKPNDVTGKEEELSDIDRRVFIASVLTHTLITPKCLQPETIDFLGKRSDRE